MWSRLTPRLGIGRVLAKNLQPLAVIATGQNIENITGTQKTLAGRPGSNGRNFVGSAQYFFPLPPLPTSLGLHVLAIKHSDRAISVCAARALTQGLSQLSGLRWDLVHGTNQAALFQALVAYANL